MIPAGVTSSKKWWAAKHRLVLAAAGLLSLASWGLAVLLMNGRWERVSGICAGLTTMTALFRAMNSKSDSFLGRIPLILFALALPALSGFYLSGMVSGLLSSIVILGLSIAWLGSKRLRSAVAMAAFVFAMSALVLIPADVFLRRGVANIQIEPNPACPLVRRLPRMKCWENEAPGELTVMWGQDAFKEVVPNRLATDRTGFSLVRGSSESRPYDLVLLGDSYTAHSTVDNWPEMICQDTGLNIRNLGVPATGPWDEYMNLRLEYPRMRLVPGAKILWCLFSGNDLHDFYGPLPFERVPPAGLFTRLRIANENFRRNAWLPFALRESGIQHVMGRLLAGRGRIDVPSYVRPEKILPIDRSYGLRMLFLRDYVEQARNGRHEIEAMPSFPALDATIACMANFVRTQSLDVTVLVFPSKEEVYRWVADVDEAVKPWSTPAAPTGFGMAVRGLCEKYGLPCHDLTPAFVTSSKREFLTHGDALWQRDDTHWNKRGHQLTAQLIEDLLRGSK